ncbi:uncharacterized protein LTHEOB_6415 [Lasiodiplodia theobromae]|uniref:uncharacterized protein n=1 Tax=Lasiodiplodia theobromae TaxID=45133 RepID=UPI0015C3F43C|nr:uncharacterized protein LTHEOB_6415 [Lasiodiplodia theobromae]KAF4544297.1 hypothetical protein LTHEOB_6415 [Lasiodiplodia theobromae]
MPPNHIKDKGLSDALVRLPDWADEDFLRVFNSVSSPEKADKLDHPKKHIIKRALEGWLTVMDVLAEFYPLPKALIPLWIPTHSWVLLNYRMNDKTKTPADLMVLVDFDRSKEILTIHNFTRLHLVLRNALVRAIYEQVNPLCLSDVSGKTWRMFRAGNLPLVPNGDDTRNIGGQKFEGWTAFRMADFALYYNGPCQNPRHPDLIVEIGTRDKAAALEERAKWLMNSTDGETRIVVGIAYGEGESTWTISVWKLGERGINEGPVEKITDRNGHPGVAIPIRDMIASEAVECIEQSTCPKTRAVLDKKIEITWADIAQYADVTGLIKGEEPPPKKPEQQGGETKV